MAALPTSQGPVTVRTFAQRLSPTPRGARLARYLALNQLHAWGIPHGSDPSDAVAVIVAELAANAVTHGRVPGRDFELRLALVTGSVRIEVTDTRPQPRPRPRRTYDGDHPVRSPERGAACFSWTRSPTGGRWSTGSRRRARRYGPRSTCRGGCPW